MAMQREALLQLFHKKINIFYLNVTLNSKSLNLTFSKFYEDYFAKYLNKLPT